MQIPDLFRLQTRVSHLFGHHEAVLVELNPRCHNSVVIRVVVVVVVMMMMLLLLLLLLLSATAVALQVNGAKFLDHRV